MTTTYNHRKLTSYQAEHMGRYHIVKQCSRSRNTSKVTIVHLITDEEILRSDYIMTITEEDTCTYVLMDLILQA